ncbi:MAG: efflux RND transporter periplasmic adaptor subunit [Halioglobus sp.]|nr:efflux RND transporter periplasmic adaptor subunit [Halioglobus sp.]
MSMRYRVLVIILLAAAAAAAFFLRLPSSGSTSTYLTAPVSRGDISHYVLASGRLQALVTVDIGSQVSGMIKSLSADYNTAVVEGQELARIDPALFEARLQQAEAELAAARAQVEIQTAGLAASRADRDGLRAVSENTGRELERKRAMLARGGLGQSDVDTAQAEHARAIAQVRATEATVTRQKAEVALARTEVERMTAVVRQRQLDLDHTYIRSSVNGVIIKRFVDAGQTIAAGLQTPVLFRVAQDLSEMELSIAVDEADIGLVQRGAKVVFSVDAYPGESFEAGIVQIRKSGEEQSNVVTYTVIARAPNPEQRLLPGMTANVAIAAINKRDARKLPTAALYFVPPAANTRAGATGQRVWLQARDGSLQAVPVKTGVSDGEHSELLEGDLRDGQQVIVGIQPHAGN